MHAAYSVSQTAARIPWAAGDVMRATGKGEMRWRSFAQETLASTPARRPLPASVGYEGKELPTATTMHCCTIKTARPFLVG